MFAWLKTKPAKVIEKERVVEQRLYYPKDSSPVALYSVVVRKYVPSSYGGHYYERLAGYSMDVEEALAFIDRRPKNQESESVQVRAERAFKGTDGIISTAAEFTPRTLGLSWPTETP